MRRIIAEWVILVFFIVGGLLLREWRRWSSGHIHRCSSAFRRLAERRTRRIHGDSTALWRIAGRWASEDIHGNSTTLGWLTGRGSGDIRRRSAALWRRLTRRGRRQCFWSMRRWWRRTTFGDSWRLHRVVIGGGVFIETGVSSVSFQGILIFRSRRNISIVISIVFGDLPFSLPSLTWSGGSTGPTAGSRPSAQVTRDRWWRSGVQWRRL